MKKIITLMSWNVNGIRAAIQHGMADFLKTKKPDILCLQEVKINDAMRAKTELDFPGYEEFWNSAQRPGYAGTAMFIKEGLTLPILNKTTGIGVKKFNSEGRVQTLEFKKFYLINAYFPHSRHDLSRLDFKLEFDNATLRYIKKLQGKKPVIVTGDFNVAHQEIDLANPKTNKENPGFLPEEREWMTKFLNAGFIDTFRYLHPKKIQYSWWSYKFNARARNVGWRIDYFCVSKKLKNKIKSAQILDKIKGSDHCPIQLNLEIPI